MTCIFCDIASGKMKTPIIYQDDLVVAFPDLHPQAPHHILIIPHKHIATLNDATEKDTHVLGHMMVTSQQLAKKLNIATEGFRVVMNINKQAGQTVFHIHLHLLGGRTMDWPPG